MGLQKKNGVTTSWTAGDWMKMYADKLEGSPTALENQYESDSGFDSQETQTLNSISLCSTLNVSPGKENLNDDQPDDVEIICESLNPFSKIPYDSGMISSPASSAVSIASMEENSSLMHNLSQSVMNEAGKVLVEQRLTSSNRLGNKRPFIQSPGTETFSALSIKSRRSTPKASPLATQNTQDNGSKEKTECQLFYVKPKTTIPRRPPEQVIITSEFKTMGMFEAAAYTPLGLSRTTRFCK